MFDHESTTYNRDYDPHKRVYSQAVPSTDWQLLIVLDQAALESPLTPMLLQQLGIATLVVIAAALLISLLVQWLLAPFIGRVSSVRTNCQWSRGFNP